MPLPGGAIGRGFQKLSFPVAVEVLGSQVRGSEDQESRMLSKTAALASAALGCVCGVLLLSSRGSSRGSSSALEVVRRLDGQMLATRQEEEEVGALNSWNSKGTMYIKTPGMFAAGSMGMDTGGAALMVRSKSSHHPFAVAAAVRAPCSVPPLSPSFCLTPVRPSSSRQRPEDLGILGLRLQKASLRQ